MKSKAKVLAIIIATSVVSMVAQADSLSKLTRRSRAAAAVLKEVMFIPDHSIPKSLLDRAICVATVPNVVRAAFVFGARYGKGLVSCRTPSGWSHPTYMSIKGGSWGLQIGIQSVDIVLVFMQPSAIHNFSRDNFTIGVNATVAAGPIGRDAQIGTNYKLESEIYSYSRTRGLFAGVSLQGTEVGVEEEDNARVYGDVQASRLLSSDGNNSPAAVAPYFNALLTYAP